MKKILVFTLVFTAVSTFSFAQKTYKAKKKMKLTIVGTDGTNGCSVAYNPDKSVYYASIAGNADYPLETFSKKGKNISTREAGEDLRGVWYNTNSGKLEANCYGEGGIINYSINNDGSPSSPSSLYDGEDHQPTDQSVGAYNPSTNKIYYLDGNEIQVYNRAGGNFETSFDLRNSPVSSDYYNYTTVVFTGRAGMELGVLSYENKEVLLFDLAGNYKAKVAFPSDAIGSDAFRFSCANGMLWLYDVDARSWTGYKF